MAKVDGVELALDVLQRFHPLTLITEAEMARVLHGASVMQLAKGQFLFRKNPPADVSYLLLEGEVEARESFDSRNIIAAGGSQPFSARGSGAQRLLGPRTADSKVLC